MSYAVRKDGQGFRAVAKKEDCTGSETWSATVPVLAPTPSPQPLPEASTDAAVKAKLKAFLAANPDVLAALNSQQ
jgi:hypothetical protein